jgi:membrane protein YdbS with pleckstrin-like domain
MTLIPDWRRVLRMAWSIRLALLAGLLSAAEAVLPWFAGDMPISWFAGLSALAAIGAVIARLLAQPEMHR